MQYVQSDLDDGEETRLCCIRKRGGGDKKVDQNVKVQMRRQITPKPKERNCVEKYCMTYKRFMNSPRVHFFYDSVSIYLKW